MVTFQLYSQGCTQQGTLHCWGSTANYYSLEFINGDVVSLKDGGSGGCSCYLDGNCVDQGDTV